MSVPPEVVFHRFFQTLSPAERAKYRGKHDLSGLPPTVEPFLMRVQETFNEALGREKQNVPEHVDHPPFHVDYVDSDIPNAFAFRYKGYSTAVREMTFSFRVGD